jgi:TfuA protein
MHDIAIFLGPSLTRDRAQAVLKADYHPPIKRGDLAKLERRVKTVGIIDGEFYQSLALSPKEVLQELDRGVAVYGGSSMGALRAAETHVYGMVGIGEIFRAYRDGLIEGDDEVALTYRPDTYSPLSDALINIRHAFDIAVHKEILEKNAAQYMLAYLKKQYFPFRSYRLLAELYPEHRSFLLQEQPDLKAQDAVLLLKHIAKRHH